MWTVVGQDKAVTFLQKSLEKGSLAHAYLLVGLPHVGKMTLAVNLAMAINCESPERPCGKCAACLRIAAGKHADVQVIELSQIVDSEGESKTKISVEQVDQILHSVNLAPYEGKYKVFIIDGVEFMSIGAANRLLKTIEEPVQNVIFILLTSNESLVPATIVSRCQRIELLPVAGEIIDTRTYRNSIRLTRKRPNYCPGLPTAASAGHYRPTQDDALIQQRTEWLDAWREMFDADYDRRFTFAAKLVEKYTQNRSIVQQKLDLLLGWWHDLLLVKADCAKDIVNIDYEKELKKMAAGYSLRQIRAFIARIQSAKEQLRSNTNQQLVMEVLMLNIPEKKPVENLVA